MLFRGSAQPLPWTVEFIRYLLGTFIEYLLCVVPELDAGDTVASQALPCLGPHFRRGENDITK